MRLRDSSIFLRINLFTLRGDILSIAYPRFWYVISSTLRVGDPALCPFSAKEEVVDALGEAERGEVGLEGAASAIEGDARHERRAHVPEVHDGHKPLKVLVGRAHLFVCLSVSAFWTFSAWFSVVKRVSKFTKQVSQISQYTAHRRHP